VHALARLAHGKKLFVVGRPPPEVLGEVAGAYSTAVLASCDELAGMCFMLQSGMFDLYGHGGLASVNAQLHLRTRNPGTPEDGCDAYCKLAAHRFAAGDVDLARELLAEAARLFPRGTPASRLWLTTQLEIEFQLALYREDWEKAEELDRVITGPSGTQIGDIRNGGIDAGGSARHSTTAGTETDIDALFRRSLLQLARRHFDAAAAEASRGLEALEVDLKSPTPSVPLAQVSTCGCAHVQCGGDGGRGDVHSHACVCVCVCVCDCNCA
jgi:hypothetical protein